jgi:hypothetical protein
LTGQLQVTARAVATASALAERRLTHDAAHAELTDMEHAGDSLRESLVTTLSRSLVTPIDREDIFRLSRSVDSILDSMRDYVRLQALLRPGDSFDPLPVLVEISAAVSELTLAVSSLEAGGGRKLTVRALAARKAAGRARRAFQYELARSCEFETSGTELVKWQALGFELVNAVEHIRQSSDALVDGAIKRWKSL